MLGDPRANENPGLLSLGLILYRWHNIQARRIQKENPDWTDEDVFQVGLFSSEIKVLLKTLLELLK